MKSLLEGKMIIELLEGSLIATKYYSCSLSDVQGTQRQRSGLSAFEGAAYTLFKDPQVIAQWKHFRREPIQHLASSKKEHCLFQCQD